MKTHNTSAWTAKVQMEHDDTLPLCLFQKNGLTLYGYRNIAYEVLLLNGGYVWLFNWSESVRMDGWMGG